MYRAGSCDTGDYAWCIVVEDGLFDDGVNLCQHTRIESVGLNHPPDSAPVSINRCAAHDLSATNSSHHGRYRWSDPHRTSFGLIFPNAVSGAHQLPKCSDVHQQARVDWLTVEPGS